MCKQAHVLECARVCSREPGAALRLWAGPVLPRGCSVRDCPRRPTPGPVARTPCCCFRTEGFTLAKIWIVCFTITSGDSALTLDLSESGPPKTSCSHLLADTAALATVTKDATQTALRAPGSRLLSLIGRGLRGGAEGRD